MELSSAERYNPHTNSWSPIVAMTSRRSGVRYFTQNNMNIDLIYFTYFLGGSRSG